MYNTKNIGRFYQLKERWETIEKTFIEYINIGNRVFQQKENELSERLKMCSDECE